MKEKMSPIKYDPCPAENAYDKILNFSRETNDQQLRDAIEKSLEIVEECLTKYQPENVSVCFNGGKECIT